MVDFVEIPAATQAASDAGISGLSAADRWQIVAVALRSIGCTNPRPAPISRAGHPR